MAMVIGLVLGGFVMGIVIVVMTGGLG